MVGRNTRNWFASRSSLSWYGPGSNVQYRVLEEDQNKISLNSTINTPKYNVLDLPITKHIGI